MYPIDFTTCTMLDVIQRSYVCHPTVLSDRLADAGATHRQARDTMVTGSARAIADRMSTVAYRLAASVRDQELDVSNLDSDARIIAFTCAARLQCLSHAIMTDIAKRETV